MAKPFTIKATPVGAQSDPGRKPNPTPAKVIEEASKSGVGLLEHIAKEGYNLDWQPEGAPKDTASDRPVFTMQRPWPEAKTGDERAERSAKPFKVK